MARRSTQHGRHEMHDVKAGRHCPGDTSGTGSVWHSNTASHRSSRQPRSTGERGTGTRESNPAATCRNRSSREGSQGRAWLLTGGQSPWPSPAQTAPRATPRAAAPPPAEPGAASRASTSNEGKWRRRTRGATVELATARGTQYGRHGMHDVEAGQQSPGSTSGTGLAAQQQTSHTTPQRAGSPEHRRAWHRNARQPLFLQPHVGTEVAGKAAGVALGRGYEQTGRRVAVWQKEDATEAHSHRGRRAPHRGVVSRR